MATKRMLLQLLALTVAYVAAARLGLAVAFIHSTISPVWPPSGLAIAALALGGPRLWPAVTVGAFAANFLIAGDSVTLAAGIALGNTVEALAGARLLRRFRVLGEVARVRDAVVILATAALAPLPSATGGVLCVSLAGFSPWSHFAWSWLVWWLGDFMGALLFVPLILAWAGRRAPQQQPPRPAEFAGALILATALVSYVYLQADAWATLGIAALPRSAFLFPPMVWAVLRLRPRETWLVVVVASTLAAIYTVSLSPGAVVGLLLELQMLLLGVGGGTLLLQAAIVEEAHTHHALRLNEERLRYVTEAAEIGYWHWDIGSDRLEWSAPCKEMFGIPGDAPMSYARFLAALHPQDRERADDAVQAALAGKRSYDLEYRSLWPDGAVRWIHAKGRVEFAPEGQPTRMGGIAIDISAHKEMEDELRRVSQHDPLTGLPNRVLLYEFAGHLLSQAGREASRPAFLFVDLDRFKPVNDTYGHTVGDAVLKEVARRLSDCVRGEDFVSRFGGDEFIIVLAHVQDEQNAGRVAAHAVRLLGQPYQIDCLDLHISPSIGISLFPNDGTTVDELIHNADLAMYHAKESGRNNVQFFRPELNARAREVLSIESRLRQGLERDEFELFFQPVVDLNSGKLKSAEALIRWPGMNVLPERFIPVAETAGFMQALGGWVLREACRQQREWRDQGLPSFPVAVNVSPTQFRARDFTRSVGDAIALAGLDAEALRIEVTESTVMKNIEAVAAVLRELQAMGVKVALDDFGTGYSSLSYLSHLPLDILKLDQSFIRDLGHERSNVAIVEAIMALARSLGLEVVAEGIESEATVAFLRQRYCRHGQGFHFSRPLPASAFRDWALRRAA